MNESGIEMEVPGNDPGCRFLQGMAAALCTPPSCTDRPVPIRRVSPALGTQTLFAVVRKGSARRVFLKVRRAGIEPACRLLPFRRLIRPRGYPRRKNQAGGTRTLFPGATALCPCRSGHSPAHQTEMPRARVELAELLLLRQATLPICPPRRSGRSGTRSHVLSRDRRVLSL